MTFILEAVRRAVAQTTPLTWKQNQGNHITGPQYASLLIGADVHLSKGR
jgi:hypothetical protein